MHVDNSVSTVNSYICDIPYSPGDLTYWGWGRTGWICPKCGRVNSPDTYSCPCSEPGRVTISTNTTGSKDFQDYLNTLPTISMDRYKEIVDAVEKKYDELSEEERKELMRRVNYNSKIDNRSNLF